MSFLSPKNKNKPTMTSPIMSLQTEMNKLMEDFFNDSLSSGRMMPKFSEESVKLQSWAPRVDISETEKEYKVTAELPGVEDKDIDINFQDNTLYITGERKFEREEAEENFHHVERSFGSFYRTIPFAAQIDEENISAEFKKGILKVRLKKSDDVISKTRKISIK